MAQYVTFKTHSDMNNKPIPHSVIEENNIADHFVDLVKSKLTNPEHLNAALRMFIAGHLPMDLISKPGMIDLPALRKQIAGNVRERRRKWFESMAEQRRLFGYYSGCTMVRHNAGKTVHFAFIDKSGHLVALGMDDGKNGGVYYANNPAQTIHPDELHSSLARIRKVNRTFYKRIKKAAFAEPLSTWKMDDRTIKHS